MNSNRKQSILKNMNGKQRKVYDAVPIKDHWSIHQIFSELKRQGIHLEWPYLCGVLNDLYAQHMIIRVVEDKTERFYRDADEKPAPTNAPLEKPIMPTAPLPPLNIPPRYVAGDLLNQLADIASKLRADAVALNTRADRIDVIAVMVDDAIKTAGAGSDELQQLKTLLKGVLT